MAVVALMAIAIVVLVQSTAAIAQPVVLNESAKLAACRSDTLALMKPDKIDIGLLSQISNFCYMQVRGDDLLGDFNIRRTNYVRQQFQGLVFLWMVVAITISGVVMAALQLFAAYKLASGGRGDLNQGGEITLEEKRLSLKSSVTGLLILTVSFAFFLVFVVWVYPLTETRLSPEGTGPTASQQPSPGTAGLHLLPGVGGIGPPPQAKTGIAPTPAAPTAPAQPSNK